MEPFTDPAHEQRHVRTLAAAVRVQLVQDQEVQAFAVADDLAVELLLPCHEELQHHEVGEKDVRGLACNPLPLAPVVLPRVAVERDRPLSRHLVDELGQLIHLRVGERVHRVDDDGVRAPLAARVSCSQHVADDGDEEAERLPGPRAGGHHEALAVCGKRDRLLLVLVEGQRLVVCPEYIGAARIEDAVDNQGADVCRALVARVDLDERLGPVAILGVDGLNLLADIWCVNRRERCCEAPVLVDDAVAQGKYVEHRSAGVRRTVGAR